MTREKVLENLRDAIQQAENFGLVRDEEGQPLTGVKDTEHGFVVTQE